MFMDIALRTAELSNCVKYHVGAVVIRDKRIILQGYNGTMAEFINCDEKFAGVDMSIKENRLKHRKWSAATELHSEMNIVTYAANKGIALEGSTMYITHKPCNNCLKHLIPAGIIKIVYKEDYVDKNSEEDTEELLKFVEIEKYEE